VERTKTPSTIKVPTPVTFPESYPFSLIASLPEPPRGVSNLSYVHEGNTFFEPSLGETAVVLLVLIMSSPAKHIQNFLESSVDIEGRDRFVSLLSHFFKVSTSILENDAFPRTWMNINVLAHKVLIKIMDPIGAMMEKEFIPHPDSEAQFDANLWKECFLMLLKLLSSDQLMIEEFSPQVLSTFLLSRFVVDDLAETTSCLASCRRYSWRRRNDSAEFMASARQCRTCFHIRGTRNTIWGKSLSFLESTLIDVVND